MILHSEPRAGATVEGLDAGVWCTINGPRAGWDRRATYVDRGLGPPTVKLRGSEPLKVLTELMGRKAQWVQLSGELKQVMLPKPREVEDFKTKAVFHLLGYSFESRVVEGSNPNYDLKVEAGGSMAYAYGLKQVLLRRASF